MSSIAVLVGSPRTNGNTMALVNAFIDGADGKNNITVIPAASMDVSPCRGCNCCYGNENNECIQKDDMTQIMEILQDADIIVIATPIYFYGMSAQLKTVVDRLHTPKRNSFRVRGLVLLAVGATAVPNLFDSVVSQYESALKFFGLKDYGRVLVGGVKDIGDIEGRSELKSAEELGKTIL